MDINDEEIVEHVLQAREESESENEDEASLEWLESKGNTHPAHLMLVRDDAAQRRLKSTKQTKITSYFNPFVPNPA